MRTHRFFTIAIAPLLSFALAACGGDDSTGGSTPGQDAGNTKDSSIAPPIDAAPPVDASPGTDAATKTDAGVDAATPTDANVPTDANAPVDATADAGPKTVDVTVGPNGGFVFDPTDVTIKVGDTVRWTWAASGHTVTSGDSTACTADNAFCSPNDTTCGVGQATSNTADTYSHTFTTAGTFDYFCEPHCAAGMKGSVTVQ